MATAWVTWATNDSNAIGALVLAKSIRRTQSIHKLHVLYTADVTAPMVTLLQNAFDNTTLVNVLDKKDKENARLASRPDLQTPFVKLQCWRLTQYSKAVFLDPDVLVMQNADELFERPEFSAAPAMGYPDYFNSAVFVFVPSAKTYNSILDFALKLDQKNYRDNSILNKYYSTWRELPAAHRLPMKYNLVNEATGDNPYIKASDIKIAHFINKKKPWLKGEERVPTAAWDLWKNLNQNLKKKLPKKMEPALSREEGFNALDQIAPMHTNPDEFLSMFQQVLSGVNPLANMMGGLNLGAV